jgi:hypothetical protein
LRAGLVLGEARSLRQKPEHCLIANALSEQVRLLDSGQARP